MKGARLWVPPLLLMAVAFALVLGDLLDTTPVFADFDNYQMSFPSGKKEAVLSEGDYYGPIDSRGPGFNLDPGRYRLRWSAYNDGENALLLSFENGAHIEPAELVMGRDQEDGEFYFDVLEPGKKLRVTADFRDGTHLSLLFLSLYAPPVKDAGIVFLLLAAVFSLIWFLAGTGRLDGHRAMPACLLAGALFLACAPALRGGAGIWQDKGGMRQLARVESLAAALKAGAFPAWFSLNSGGGKAAFPIFMPELPLLPFAFVRTAASAACTLNLMIIAVNLVCLLAGSAAFRRLFCHGKAAAAAAACFLLFPLRLDAVYRQAALGETAGTACAILLCVMAADLRMAERAGPIRLAAVGASAFYLCPTAALAGWLLALVLTFGNRFRRGDVLRGAGFCILLCAWQLLPILWLHRFLIPAVMRTAKPALYVAVSVLGAAAAGAIVRCCSEEKRATAAIACIGLTLVIGMKKIDTLSSRGGLSAGTGVNPDEYFDTYDLPADTESPRIPSAVGAAVSLSSIGAAGLFMQWPTLRRH